jgi:hypothetical protein
MSIHPRSSAEIFIEPTKTSFPEHTRTNSSKRRISQSEKNNIINWLTDIHSSPLSQKEFSRRNYVRKQFFWDEQGGVLLANPKSSDGSNRIVVTEDEIPEVVAQVHQQCGHAGWDATWRAINSSYYGILRSDSIFLLKRCRICLLDPAKRPKNWATILELQEQAKEKTASALATDITFQTDSTEMP